MIAVTACAALLTGALTTVGGAAPAIASSSGPTLAAHWTFDEGSGTTAADSSGNGYTGTLGSDASWTSTSRIGSRSVAFNGASGGNVDVSQPVVDTSQSFTVSAWVKLNSTSGYQTAVSIDGTKLSGFYLQLSGATGKFSFTRRASDSTSAAEVRADSTVAPTTGTWYHLVGVDDVAAGQLKVYVDGVEGTDAAYTSAWKATGHTEIGRGLWGGSQVDFLNGSVDDVQIYQGAATIAEGPCEIYEADKAPCVAAHSTVRGLYSLYGGSLYQVKRASDGTTKDIGVLSDGYANAATQDSFCAATTCTITKIYDQSSQHNDLTIEGGGGANPTADVGAPADALPVTVGGHQVYGVEISAGMGYRNDATSGVAINGKPEGMYMVTSGTHVNGSCCFDYGNAETNNKDTGNGHMDAINFSTECWFSPCYGQGPWVQADLENGLFQSDLGYSTNKANTGTGPLPFVTALLKNNGQDHFALKDGNAQSGSLTTNFSGSEPSPPTYSGYSPMQQEGAIVLGTGGDNSNWSIGSFFEGVMTAGYPSDTADDSVQKNIVSVGYGGSTGSVGTLTAGSEISLQATTPGYTGDYIRHYQDKAIISPITSSSPDLDKNDATWIVRRGLADNSCFSFESKNYPGDYLRHQNFILNRQPDDGSALFMSDATFCSEPGKNGQGNSFKSSNFPTKYIRHYYGNVYIADNGVGTNAWDTSTSWSNDVSWVVSQPWAP